jgi:hypothetical protein
MVLHKDISVFTLFPWMVVKRGIEKLVITATD